MSKRLESGPDALKIGKKVWLYEDGMFPRVGEITKYGLRDVPDTWYVRDQCGERLYLECRIFTDPIKLVSAVEDTITHLSRWLRDNDDFEGIANQIQEFKEAE
jgi:hypothetical protein